jgi:hypothetical protein
MSLLKNAFVSMVKGSMDWDKQLAQVLGKKKFLPDSYVAELAEAICSEEMYNCYLDVAENGMYRFYKTDEVSSKNIHEGAKKCWQRHVAHLHNIKRSNRGGDTSTKVDEVANEIKRLKEKYTKSQCKRIANEIV